MKYLDVIENEFNWDISHYKKLLVNSHSNNKDLEELIKRLNDVVEFYLKKIEENDYIITPQDIVAHLGLTRHFVDKNILPSLNTLYPPTIKEGSWLFKQIFSTKLNKLLIKDEKNSDTIKSYIKNIINNRVLVSKRDYIKYLEEHMKTDKVIIKIDLSLTKEELNNLYTNYINKYNNESISKIHKNVVIKNLFNDFKKFNLNSYTKAYKEIKVDFEKMCNYRFNINPHNSLKNFNIVPIKEFKKSSNNDGKPNINRNLKNENIVILNFKPTNNIEKIIKCYCLDLNCLNLNLCNANIIGKDKNGNKIYFQETIDVNIFLNKYNLDNEKLNLDFVKYISKSL